MDCVAPATFAAAMMDGVVAPRIVLIVSTTLRWKQLCLIVHGIICTEECPYGTAWSDKASADNVAHRSAVCSNRGICQHKTGQCKCLPGYTGHACQRS
jgi:heterodisulfide reductase subunit A-like polyferredoxin